MSTCNAKHTSPQIPDADWKCPKCGAKADAFDKAFIVEESADDASDDCVMLHDHDLLHCYNCDYQTTGKAFAARYAKQQDLVKCPCCKGKGVVSSSHAAKMEKTL